MAVQHLSPGNQPWHVGYRMLRRQNITFAVPSILYPKSSRGARVAYGRIPSTQTAPPNATARQSTALLGQEPSVYLR